MIIEFALEVSNLAWRVSQSKNGGAIFTLTKWSPMFGSVVFDYQWCILIGMSVKSSFYNKYDIKNNEKHVLWAQRSFSKSPPDIPWSMSGKNRTSPKKIGPLVHLDMSGKYGTGPTLLTVNISMVYENCIFHPDLQCMGKIFCVHMLRSLWCAAQMGHFWGPQSPYIWVHFWRNVLRIGSYILSSSLQLGSKQCISAISVTKDTQLG